MTLEKPKRLPIKPIDVAVEEAKALINQERSGIVTGLYTRWDKINRAKFKYWRFRNVTMIAGMSGSGKSAILNMIEDDFTNPHLNPKFLCKFNPETKDYLWDGKHILEPKICILAFKFEMDAADEVLRNLSGKTKKSYSHLLSSQHNSEETKKTGKEVYNTVSDKEFEELSNELDKLKSRPIKYIETAGNLEQIWATCAAFKEQFPEKQLVVTLDHTLLSEKLSEKDDLELTSNSARLAIRLKKAFNALVIFLGQLNGEIEKPIRRDNPDLQFPVKTDIHCGNQIYWACDDVVIFHRPEILNITKYGKRPFPMLAMGLVHCAWIKSRKNRSGNIWFENLFHEGNMREIDPNEMKWKATDSEFIG